MDSAIIASSQRLEHAGISTESEEQPLGEKSGNHLIPECLGKSRCPMAPHNAMRSMCQWYKPCVAEFIRRLLRKGKYPRTILRDLKKVVNGTKEPTYGASDTTLLLWIADVCAVEGYRMGRKAVDGAIANSNVGKDGDLMTEAIQVRKAFGVYGRDGKSHRKNEPPKRENLDAE